MTNYRVVQKHNNVNACLLSQGVAGEHDPGLILFACALGPLPQHGYSVLAEL